MRIQAAGACGRRRRSHLQEVLSVGPEAYLAAVLCLATCASMARGADWPQWGGRNQRNMVSDEKGLPESFVPGKKRPSGGGIDMATTENVRWAARLGNHVYGNPTVAGGRVFVGTTAGKGGMLLCLDEATGKTIWKLVVPARVFASRKCSPLLNSH